MDTEYDVAVIGGGPAGMMSAGRSAEKGARVVLIEKNPTLGKKLLITGGGRCNILHALFDMRLLTEKYGKKGKSLFSAFSRFGVQETWDFFESRGLKLKIEEENRAFPITNSAEDVQRTLIQYMKKCGVTVLLNAPVISLEESQGLIKKVVLKNTQIQAKNYILATGGKSRPETGSTGDGFVWAKALGHTVVTPDPALVPVTIRNPWIKNVEGISLASVRLSIFQDGKKYDSRVGKMLFTGTGLSGPLVLNMSKSVGEFLKHGQVLLSLDLFPTLDVGAVAKKLLAVFDHGKNRMIKNAIGEVVEQRLGAELLTLAGIDERIQLHQVTREQRMTLAKLLKDISMTVSGLLGAEKAIVTGGGIDLKEVDFATMRSKFIQNLYLAGDILDFDRPSGGFSLQICWTTGYIAGDNAGQISGSAI